MPIHRAWSQVMLNQAKPGIFVIGEGWLEELGVRYRIIGYDHEYGIWFGERISSDDRSEEDG